MEVSVQLRCKKYVAHYLRNKYGDRPRLTRATPEGIFFLNVLSRRRKERDRDLPKSEEVIDVYISIEDFERYGGELTRTAMADFNEMIEGKLKELFEAFMCALVDVGGYQKHASIRHFQEKYGFSDEEWHFYALKKHYQRTNSDEKTLKAA